METKSIKYCTLNPNAISLNDKYLVGRVKIDPFTKQEYYFVIESHFNENLAHHAVDVLSKHDKLKYYIIDKTKERIVII